MTTLTTTQKARFAEANPRSESWQVLHAVADRFIGRFQGPFVHSVQRARSSVRDDDVRRSLEQRAPVGSLVDVFDHVLVAKQADPVESANLVYRQIILEVVQGLDGFMQRQFGVDAARVAAGFDVTNPFVVRAADTLTANLIRGVDLESKRNIQRLIRDAVLEGIPPRDAARILRVKELIGLTERQGLQVNQFRRGLMEAGRSADQIDRLVGRFSNRLLRRRSVNIARTETMLASNRGQQTMWRAMAERGVIDLRTFRQEWLVTRDDRLCSRCRPMGTMRDEQGKVVKLAERAPLGQGFRETRRGVSSRELVPVLGDTVLSPPLHPSCRCVLIAVVD